MTDPFSKDQSNQQLVREAQIGLALAFIIIASVGSWTYYQYQSFKHSIPKHVQNAPVATHIAPDVYLSKLEHRNSKSEQAAISNQPTIETASTPLSKHRPESQAAISTEKRNQQKSPILHTPKFEQQPKIERQPIQRLSLIHI